MTARVLLVAALAAAAAGCALEPPDKVALRQLYTPRFAPAPPPEPALVSLRKWIGELRTPAKPPDRSAFLPAKSPARR